MDKCIQDSSCIEDNKSFSPFLVEYSIAACTTSYVILGLDLYFLLAIGTKVLNAMFLDLDILLFVSFGLHFDGKVSKLE